MTLVYTFHFVSKALGKLWVCEEGQDISQYHIILTQQISWIALVMVRNLQYILLIVISAPAGIVFRLVNTSIGQVQLYRLIRIKKIWIQMPCLKWYDQSIKRRFTFNS